MKSGQATAWVLLSFWGMFGCDSARDPAAMPKPTAPISTIAPDAKPSKALRRNEKLLAADERRVPVFVVPGDALVEVDGQRVERRDGVVELVGKVGDVFRLRAWKGEKSSDTKEITIGEAGANPAIVDVFEVKPLAKNLKSKPKAARFDLDE